MNDLLYQIKTDVAGLGPEWVGIVHRDGTTTIIKESELGDLMSAIKSWKDKHTATTTATVKELLDRPLASDAMRRIREKMARMPPPIATLSVPELDQRFKATESAILGAIEVLTQRIAEVERHTPGQDTNTKPAKES